MKNSFYFGTWLAIGSGMGTAIGVATKNIGAGVAFGIGFGLLMEVIIRYSANKKDKDKKHEDDL